MVDAPSRVTEPLLDVLEVLVKAFQAEEDVHGWAIMKAVKRSGPTVYGVVDRLETLGWITGRWEPQHGEGSRPRRRFYRFTPTGASAAQLLLAERRPHLAVYVRPSRPTTGLAIFARIRGRRFRSTG